MTEETDRAAEIVGAWRERLDRGEAADPEDLVRAHPDLAEELRARLTVLQLLDRRRGVPASIGEYRILREIGRGGMGVVYEAEQTTMRRRVALKVLFPSVTSSPKAVKRFQQEAWAAGRLKHTNIVAVHQLGEERGAWYCAMELVEGRPLSEVIAELRRVRRSPRETGLAQAALGRTPVATSGRATGARAYHARIAEMFAEVADALETAHESGVVHRDVKPGNLLLDAVGRLKLADFGLARLEEGAASMTVTGEMLGTPLYMSPEQIAGGHRGVDHRTDVYSLGATLYEALTLRPPFRGENVQQLSSAILRARCPAPRRWNRTIPRDLETIVLKAMDPEPARRYRTAGEMARDLRLFAEGAAITARRMGPLGRAWRMARRNKVKSGLAAAGLLLAAVAAVAYARAGAEARSRRDLEYAVLCMEAEGQRLAAALAAASPSGAVPLGEDRSEATYERAIALDPDRHEAYFGLTLHPGRPMERRLASLAEAERRGAPERTVHLARALIHATAGQWDLVREEERLAALSQRGDATDRLFEATIRYLRGDHEGAERLFTDAIGLAQPGSATGLMALFRRGLLREDRRDHAGALEDFLGLQAGARRGLFIQLRIASLWRRLSHPERAEAILDGLLEASRSSGSADPWIALCNGLNQCGMYECFDRVWKEIPAHQTSSKELLRARIGALSGLRRWEEALALLERMAALDPNDPRVHSDRGLALVQLRRRDEALAAYDHAIRLDPSVALLHSNRGTVLKGLRRYEEALAAYDRAIELDPRFAPAYSNRGNALIDMSRYDEALASCDRAIELDPRKALAHSNRARALLALGRPAEALEAADRAVAIDPAEHGARVDALVKLGRIDDALKECNRVLGIEPSSALAHANRGIVLERLGQLADALGAYDRAVALDPNMAAAHRERGNILGNVGRSDEALQAYDRAIELDPGDALSHMSRGVVLWRGGRLHDALAAYERSLELDPSHPLGHMNRGAVLGQLGRHADALRELDLAIALDPSSAVAHVNRAAVFEALGRLDDAVKALERAEALAPESPELPHTLATLLAADSGASRERSARAVQAARRAVGLAPQQAKYWNTLGVALYRAGSFEESRQALGKSMDLGSGGGPADWLFLAMALHRLGQRDDAIHWYKKSAAWLRVRASMDPDLARWRAEAAEVIGIAPVKK